MWVLNARLHTGGHQALLNPPTNQILKGGCFFREELRMGKQIMPPKDVMLFYRN